MTVDEARAIALSFEGVYESAHNGHPDFRVPKGIFATLWPEKGRGVLRLPLELAEANENGDSLKIVSRSGGIGWLAAELPFVEQGAFTELVEIAWHTRLER